MEVTWWNRDSKWKDRVT